MKTGKIQLTAMLLLAGSAGVHAQQRKCDMGITLVSPAANAVIAPYASFDVTVKIVNNGPDDLLAGDTIYYNTPSMPLTSSAMFRLQQPIASGGNSTIILTTNNNVTDNPEDAIVKYCVLVVSSPAGTGAFIDGNLANNNGCSDNVTFKVLPTNGVNDRQLGKATLSLYPNPAVGTLQVALNKGLTGKVTFSIYDLSGRRISATEINTTAETFAADISGLQSGMYFAELSNASGKATGRFVKQ